MDPLVLYGVGSPLVADYEESARRAGWTVALGIRNVECESFLSPGTPLFSPEVVPSDRHGLPFLVPLFTPRHRQAAATEAAERGFSNPAILIDPTAIVPRSLVVGGGSYVNAGCVVGAHSEFGPCTVVNRGANIGHHARFSRFVSIGPGVTIAGGVTIGEGAVVGTGAVILPGVAIGANAVVGAGSVVTRDVAPGCLVFGNPARPVRRGVGGDKGVQVT